METDDVTKKLLNSSSTGAKLILMPTFSSENLLKILNEHEMTKLFIVPSIMQLMINNEKFTKKHVKKVGRIVSAAALISAEVAARFREKFGDHFIFSQG